jgi:hypothetical protein
MLVLSALWLGLLAGTAVGSAFVSRGNGLASGPTALADGVVGAVLSALFVGILGTKIPMPRLRSCALVAVLLAATSAAYVGYRVHEQMKPPMSSSPGAATSTPPG